MKPIPGKLLCAWPWLAVLAVAFYAAWPLWSASGQLFGLVAGDSVQTAWFYDYVARQILEGGGLDYLADLNYPSPLRRIDEFPNYADAVIAAPLAWWSDWPEQYAGAQGLCLVFNALGTALLARVLGCRGMGIVLAGSLGAFSLQVWKELYMARLNAASPGIAVAALATWLAVLSPPAQGHQWVKRGLLALCAAVLGYLSAVTYPPFLLMLVPAGLLLGLVRCWKARWSGVLLALLALGGSLVAAAPELEEIRRSPRSMDRRYGDDSWCLATGTAETQVLCTPEIRRAKTGIGQEATHLQGVRWFRWRQSDGQGIPVGVALPLWVLALLSPLGKQRGVSLGLLGVAGTLAFLSLGPCPEWSPERSFDYPSGDWLSSWLLPAWCHMASLHDYGRLASGATLLLAALSGLGVEALGQRLPGRTRTLAVVLAAGVGLQAGRHAMAEAVARDHWVGDRALPTTDFLRSHPDAVVAELPFDRRLQYISLLVAPGPTRVNPLNTKGRGYSADLDAQNNPEAYPFVAWLHHLSQGEVPSPAPTFAQAADSGVDWVLLDPTRCRGGGLGPWPDADRNACSPRIVLALTRILGEPTDLGSGAKAWSTVGP